jgi:hypothetical protein
MFHREGLAISQRVVKRAPARATAGGATARERATVQFNLDQLIGTCGMTQDIADSFGNTVTLALDTSGCSDPGLYYFWDGVYGPNNDNYSLVLINSPLGTTFICWYLSYQIGNLTGVGKFQKEKNLYDGPVGIYDVACPCSPAGDCCSPPSSVEVIA